MDRRNFLIGFAGLALTSCHRQHREISVGSKNFTEQLLLGELLAQVLARDTSLPIERRFYLAGSYICHQAILAGRIDTYIEYTGTALLAILKEARPTNPQTVFDTVKQEYLRRFNLIVLPSLGFNNSFVLVMRRDDAASRGITKISDLTAVAPAMRIGVGYEFLDRPDGFSGLARTYHLRFAEPPRVMDLGLLYRALISRQVDIVVGSNTDGMIAALNLAVLRDDRNYFPPYDAVPIVRPNILMQVNGARAAFNQICGHITADEMRQMNYRVDGEKQTASDVVRNFVETRLTFDRAQDANYAIRDI